MAGLRIGSQANREISGRTPLRRVSVRRSRLHVRAQASENPFAKIGSQLVKAGSQLTETLTGTTRVAKQNEVNDNTVFVAGATGRVGARVVKECVLAGFNVRAGVRNLDKGNELVETAKQYNLLTPEELKRINLVEYDLLDRDTIAPAIGNAACVVSAIGAPEDKPFDTSAPKKIDGEAAIALVEEAKNSGVKRFIMVTSLGTTKIGWPASVLNLFWGVLYWKRLAEEALIQSGMAYTIIRPGGMERPTDSYKETHNTVLYPRDTQFGGQVSRLQVAELIGACVSNPELSGNKTLEVIASDAIPLRPLEELLGSVEAEISLEEMAAKQAEIADVRNRRGALAAEAEELEAQLAEAEERKVLAENAFSTARSELQEIRNESSGAQREASDAERQVADLQDRLSSSQRQEAAAKAVLDAQRRGQRSGDLLSASDIREITEPILNPPADGSAAPASSGGGGGLLGGLFGAPKPAKVEEAAEEVVEEVAEAAPAKAKRGFGALFGGKKAQEAVEEVAEEAEEVAEEVEEEVQEVKAKAKGGLGGLFGGLRKAAPKQEQAEEEAAAPAKKAPAAKKAAPEAPKDKEEESGTQVVKGGGLFGMFQQDTVYADDGAEEAPPPPEEVVERAVTKKGSGRKSVKELIARKGDDTPADEKPAAPAAEKEEAPKSRGGMFSGLVGSFNAAAEKAEAAVSEETKAASPKPPAPKPAAAAPKSAELSGAGDLAAKRSAAVAAALNNLGAAADKAEKKVGAVAEKAAPKVKKTVEAVAEKVEEASPKVQKAAEAAAEKVAEAAPQVEKATKVVADKVKDAAMKPGENGSAAKDGATEAEDWIAQWRSKQKATAKASTKA